MDRAASITTAKLALEGITHVYGETPAVRDVNLAIGEGELVALLGPSGCGKTTLLMIIAGLLSAAQGRVLIDGVDVTRMPANRRRIGVVFQNYALFPHMTVRENILFGPENLRWSPAERQAAMRSVLELVRLEHLADRYPAELSGGQQQRVALARALAIKPPLLLLDEPFSNLDAKVREAMRVELSEFLRRIGATAVVVTHDQEDASYIADRVMVMSSGKLEQVGPYHEIYHAPGSAFVADFLGHSNWLAGSVRAQFANEALVDVAGRPWRVRTPAPLDPSRPAAVLVRRNALRTVVRAAQSDTCLPSEANVIEASVERIVHVGPKLLLWLRCADQLLPFDVAAAVGFREGDRVVATLDPDLCFAFPERHT